MSGGFSGRRSSTAIGAPRIGVAAPIPPARVVGPGALAHPRAAILLVTRGGEIAYPVARKSIPRQRTAVPGRRHPGPTESAASPRAHTPANAKGLWT